MQPLLLSLIQNCKILNFCLINYFTTTSNSTFNYWENKRILVFQSDWSSHLYVCSVGCRFLFHQRQIPIFSETCFISRSCVERWFETSSKIFTDNLQKILNFSCDAKHCFVGKKQNEWCHSFPFCEIPKSDSWLEEFDDHTRI